MNAADETHVATQRISATARDEILRAIDAILRHNNHQPAAERGPIGLEILAAFANRGWAPKDSSDAGGARA